MGTSVIADDRRAVFYQTTAERAFGPTVRVAKHGERANRRVARRAMEMADTKFARLWDQNPNRVQELIAEAKRELYPAVAPEESPEVAP